MTAIKKHQIKKLYLFLYLTDFHMTIFTKLGLLILLSTFSITFNAQTFNWAKKIGGSTTDLSYSISVDDNQNLFIAGFFNGTVDFNPGAGIYNLTSSGNSSGYILKLNNNGDFLWANKIPDGAVTSLTNYNGDCYVTGLFKGTVDFDPGAGVANLTSTSSITSDGYVAKYDSNGNFIWVKHLKVEVGNLLIKIDLYGNILIGSYYNSSIDFDPGVGIFNIPSFGNSDIFILKLTSSGDFVWARRMGGVNMDVLNSISIDDQGNVYSTGYFEGTSDFNPGAGVYNFTSNNSGSWHVDVFVSKLDSSGNFVWAKQIAGYDFDAGIDIVAYNDYVYYTGHFKGPATVDFDPGPNTYNLSVGTNTDIFLSKLDALGNFIWAKQIGGNQPDGPRSLFVDSIGDIYLTGSFSGISDFDPGSGTAYLTSFGYDDVFLAKYDSLGNFINVKQIGGSFADISSSIYVNNDYIYLTGDFKGVPDFNPPNLATLPSAGSNYEDVFICSFKKCNNSENIESLIICNDYISPSGNYTWSTSGIYYDIIPNAFGCDSVLTFNITFDTTFSVSYLSYINPLDSLNLIITNNSTGNIIDYLWDFGDGSTSTLPYPQHTYASIGNYEICLTVSDSNCSKTYCDSAFVDKSIGIISVDVIPPVVTNVENMLSENKYGSIFPNPTTGKIEIYIDNSTISMVEIFDVRGQLIFSNKYNLDTKARIDISNQPNGIYFIKLTNASEFTSIQKVILNKF